MKNILTIIVLLISGSIIGQTTIDSNQFNEIFSNNLSNYNLSGLWTKSESDNIVGFIGENFERIQIHYTSITKDKFTNNLYLVKGKSKINGIIKEFEGTFTVLCVNKSENLIIENGIVKSINNSEANFEGIISVHYILKEIKQKKSGIYEGTLTTLFYIDTLNKIQYNNLDLGDNYCNNQFEGTWTSFDKKSIKKCNWGDYRIPDCGDLDVGVGEFVPNEKYLKFGWGNYCWYCTEDELKKQHSKKFQ